MKKQNWFTNWMLRATMAENPAIMTASGWHEDEDGDIVLDPNAMSDDPEKNNYLTLQNNLGILGTGVTAAMSAPVAAAAIKTAAPYALNFLDAAWRPGTKLATNYGGKWLTAAPWIDAAVLIPAYRHSISNLADKFTGKNPMPSITKEPWKAAKYAGETGLESLMFLEPTLKAVSKVPSMYSNIATKGKDVFYNKILPIISESAYDAKSKMLSNQRRKLHYLLTVFDRPTSDVMFEMDIIPKNPTYTINKTPVRFLNEDGTLTSLSMQTEFSPLKPRPYKPYLANLNLFGRIRFQINPDGSYTLGTMYLPKSADSINFQKTISENITERLKLYVSDMNALLGDDGLIVGSTTVYASGKIAGIPKDTEVLTTRSRLNACKQKLQFYKKRDLMNASGENGISELAHGDKEVDLDVLESNFHGQAVGRIAHQIYRYLFPKLYAAYSKLWVSSNMNVSNFINTPLPNPKDPTKFLTDEDLLLLIRAEEQRNPGGLSLRDARGSYKQKHIERTIERMFSPEYHADFAKDTRDMMEGYIENYTDVSQNFPNIDYSNIEKNKEFLESIGFPSIFASDPNIMKKIADSVYQLMTVLKRTISPKFSGYTYYKDLSGLEKAAFSNYAHVNGNSSGGGGNNVSANYANNAIGGTHTIVSQMDIPRYEEITNVADMLHLLRSNHVQNTLTSNQLNVLKSISSEFNGLTDRSTIGDLHVLLGELNDPKLNTTISQMLPELSYIRGYGYEHKYVGKYTPNTPLNWGIVPEVTDGNQMSELGATSSDNLGNSFHLYQNGLLEPIDDPNHASFKDIELWKIKISQFNKKITDLLKTKGMNISEQELEQISNEANELGIKELPKNRQMERLVDDYVEKYFTEEEKLDNAYEKMRIAKRLIILLLVSSGVSTGVVYGISNYDKINNFLDSINSFTNRFKTKTDDYKSDVNEIKKQGGILNYLNLFK